MLKIDVSHVKEAFLRLYRKIYPFFFFFCIFGLILVLKFEKKNPIPLCIKVPQGPSFDENPVQKSLAKVLKNYKNSFFVT